MLVLNDAHHDTVRACAVRSAPQNQTRVRVCVCGGRRRGEVAHLYLVELTLSETAAMVRHAISTPRRGILLLVPAGVCEIA